MAVSETLKDLDLTRDEVEKFTEALKNKDFRKMFIDYVEEVQNPENQAIYEKEMIEFEKQRGVDLTFVKPGAGYVIKTSGDGEKKVFINICSNDLIEKPTSEFSTEDGSRGSQWQIPHTLTPPRDDVDKKGKLCKVYDVVFHSNALSSAQKNKQFKQMLNNIACQAIESNFKVKLDRKNLKFPKMQYKGRPHSAVIRKLNNNSEVNQEDKEFMESLLSNAGCPYKPPEVNEQPKYIQVPTTSKNESKYTTPKYKIKHRSNVEMEQFVEHKAAKMNSAIPKELVIEIILPLLKSASDITLDVNERTLHLVSEKPAKYNLDLTLPYEVSENLGNAKFDKDQKKLIITLPVKRNTGVVFSDVCREDSGIESDHNSFISSPTDEADSETKRFVSEIESEQFLKTKQSETSEDSLEKNFLDDNISYILPDFTCHVFENIFAFTLHVKNVSETSLHKKFEHDNCALHLKFMSISSGFFPIHYAFYFKVTDNVIDFSNITVEVWDNNVIVQIPVKCDKKIDFFFVGIDKNSLSERYVEDPDVVNKVLQNSLKKNENVEEKSEENMVLQSAHCSLDSPIKNGLNSFPVQLSTDQSEDESIKEKPKKVSRKDKRKNKSKGKQMKSNTFTENLDGNKVSKLEDNSVELKNIPSTAIDIMGHCESSGDELSCSYSPHNKGILKNLSHVGRFISRSISESSVDEVGCASSVENCQSRGSVIAEEQVSTSFKKTVRFNDVVSKQVFRSNSSILGQRKKNQRKAKAKKRAQERKLSESELSENEERKEKDANSKEVYEESKPIDNSSEKSDDDKNDFSSDIFLMDIDF